MDCDAFSRYHPAVNFIFFMGAMGFGVVLQHPAFLVVGIAGSASYYVLLYGFMGVKRILTMLPLFIAVTTLNPLINRSGATVLFRIFDIPYTFEALAYGAVLSGMFLTMILWFGCYSAVMTGDKFTSLFGNLAPSLSLLLVMILRMVPNLIRKGRQVTGCRKSIGKGIAADSSYTEKVKNGMTVLGCLTTWALEGSIITADSIRSRGYGTAKRTSFVIYRMTVQDWVLLGAMLILAVIVIAVMTAGKASATFTPEWYIAPTSPGGLCAYCAYLLIPTLLHIEEALSWYTSRSRI